MNSNDVLVLGAGVSGLTTAYELLKFGYQVTIWSKEPAGALPPTSANAYAFWLPVRADSDPRVERWANESFAEFEKLSHVGGAGVAMRQIFELKVSREEPWYAGKVAGFRHAAEGEISAEYTDAHVIERVPVIDPPAYLHWLRRQVACLGGVFVKQEATRLAGCPEQYGAIVNCTGLAARSLVDDPGLHAVRLQVVTIKSNGFDKVVFDSEGPNKLACIVPHGDYIKIGAAYDEYNESIAVDDALTTGILSRCCRMVPGFQAELGDVLSVTRCLRPKRSTTRVEIIETLDDTSGADRRYVIHNYGHNGTGYIVSFGAAREVVRLLRDVHPPRETEVFPAPAAA